MIEKLELFVLLLIAVTMLFCSYKIGEMNGKIAGIDRAVEIVEGDYDS